MANYSQFKKIDSTAIIDGAVVGTKFAENSVTTAKINNNAVSTGDIQNLAVGTNQISNTLDLSGKTVTYRPIVNADLATNSNIAGSKLAAGAAVANIGFTPLNRAGGTTSGQLTLTNGTAAAPALTGTSNTNAGINFPGTNQVAISTSGTNRLTFDSNARPRNPHQPVFYASGNGGWFYNNSFPTNNSGGGWREIINGWAWQIAAQQGGSNFTSTGRFTAPVAGYYYFYASTYHYNDSNSTNGYMHWNIGRNSAIGAGNTGRAPHTIYAHAVPSHLSPGVMVSISMYMNAGDYASICPFMAAVARIHGSHSLFCGYLIG
jgi:hypothetical protein